MKWIVVIALSAFAGAAYGTERVSPGAAYDQFWEACQNLSVGAEREACFDKVEKLASLRAQLDGTPVGGVWHMSQWTDDFTDEKAVRVFVPSTKDVYVRASRLSRPQLYIQCLGNRTSLYFEFGTSVAARATQVRLRLDDDRAYFKPFDASSDYSALGLWTGKKAVPFVKSMFGAKRLLIGFTPIGENAVQMAFDISEIESAVQPVRRMCNW
jgi:type VI secretion system VasI family protein